MKKTISIVLVLVLGLTSGSYSAEGIWTTKADMPTGRWELSTSVVGGKIYAIGGAGPVYQALHTVEVYDPATDTWTTKSEMPTARQGLSTNVVNGRIYAIGGAALSSTSTSTPIQSFSAVEEYDPATDIWTTKSPMPTSRGFHSANVVDGKIYVIGGSRNADPGRNHILAVEAYDPATDTWTRKSNMPRGIGAGFSSAVDGKIYVFGGYGGASRVDEYDPVTDAWTQKSAMPTARRALSTSVLDRKIYAIGGYAVPVLPGYPGLTTVEVYDPVTDTWTTAPDMPTGRFGPRTSVVDGKIYAIGGMGYWIGAAYGTVEEYANLLVVDFNGDGIVDIKDLLRMIQSWGQDDPVVDIAPSSGDGVVDALDLELLMSYWGQQVNDPTLLAHWALDETEGMFVADSAGDNDGYTSGDPVWQPDGGQVNGAIQLDGVDDYVITATAPNPKEGSLSILAWIKGGVPGQVILSQMDGANWLCTAPSAGTLTTELTILGRNGCSLQSQAVITDDNWHRIGFVWDGLYRTLYVDGVVVAEDEQDNLGITTNGLQIGAGGQLQPGTYFSGLIDDVRIYNRAVQP